MPQRSIFDDSYRNKASSINPNQLWNQSGLSPNEQYSSGDPLENRIRFYDSYRQRQNSVPGGLINQELFDVLAGTGNIRLGSGFTKEERESLNYLKNERVKRQALKRQFEIAEKQENYGQISYGSGQQGRNSSPVSDENIAAAGGAGAGAVTGGVAVLNSPAVGAGIAAAGGTAALVALPVTAIALGIMFAVQAHQKEQARKKKRKMRTLGAAQGLIANSRGYTPTGALLSREGAMRQERSRSRDSQAD